MTNLFFRTLISTYIEVTPYLIIVGALASMNNMTLSELLSSPLFYFSLLMNIIVQMSLAFFFERQRIANEKRWVQELPKMYEERFTQKVSRLKDPYTNHPYVLKAITLNFFQIPLSLGLTFLFVMLFATNR